MININLLPKERKDQISNKRFNLYLTSITTLILFIVGIIILGIFFLKITLSNQTKTYEQTVEEKKKAIAEYDDEKSLVEGFNTSIALAKELIAKETSWTQILDDIEKATPEDLRLSGFDFGGIGGKKKSSNSTLTVSDKIQFTGLAANQRSIVKLIKKLEESKYFSSVKLTSSKTSSESSGKNKETTTAYDFKISAKINEQGK